MSRFREIAEELIADSMMELEYTRLMELDVSHHDTIMKTLQQKAKEHDVPFHEISKIWQDSHNHMLDKEDRHPPHFKFMVPMKAVNHYIKQRSKQAA